MGIAVMRAVESNKPAGERICYDPFARSFVPKWMYGVFGLFIKSGYAEWRGPGVNGYLAARERYIDDVLHARLAAGVEQLVILGAGYDSRAYRFDLAGKVMAFEVDHPATQADKVKKVVEIFGKIPEHVRFVPVDFNTQDLGESLRTAGYDDKLVTLFIWQGVSMYLTAEGVNDTLAYVVHNSGMGSAIVFDYVCREVLEGEQQSEVRSMRRYRFMTGEGLTFGIPKGKAEEYLLQRGFRQAKDIGAGELKEAYFTGKNASRKVAGGYGIAIATV